MSEEILDASTQAGHTEFFQPFISDHRGVYWDVPSKALFDSNNVGPTNINNRGLQLERPRIVEDYISHLSTLYVNHKILERAQNIENKMSKASDSDARQ